MGDSNCLAVRGSVAGNGERLDLHISSDSVGGGNVRPAVA